MMKILMLVLCFSLNSWAISLVPNPTVTIKTSRGDLTVLLYLDKAPKTVKNFLSYVDKGFYKGTIFHRVINDFMIQGGGFDEKMKQKTASTTVTNEADNGLKNEVGTLAMARTSNPHSASAQFFINIKDNAFLDHRSKTGQGWGYAVFGKVIKGMSIVNQIKKVKTATKSGHQNVPMQAIVIKEIKKI